MNNHDIDYKIYGDDMQFVEVEQLLLKLAA